MVSIATIQFTPTIFDVQNNIKRIKDILTSTTADVIVFPELATSGYFFHSREEVETVALEFLSKEMQEFQQIAKQKNAVIVLGFAESFEHKLYNSAAVFSPNTIESRVYRKTHLFYKERYCFDEGDTGFFTIQHPAKDVSIGTMICYDWRFPESARVLTLQGADLIACPSNLVTHIWTKVMPTRAIENKVYLAVANRCGTEERNGEEVSFNGQSHIYSYNGEPLVSANATDDEVLLCTIEPENTRDKSFNSENDILKDRRPEFYIV
ncbi:MAG: carbon-nitrogen hydrolase [Bacteriodetes bacterium]|nr:carbon-nitrogen hydrolase [Bacteroidota bacterium]